MSSRLDLITQVQSSEMLCRILVNTSASKLPCRAIEHISNGKHRDKWTLTRGPDFYFADFLLTTSDLLWGPTYVTVVGRRGGVDGSSEPE